MKLAFVTGRIVGATTSLVVRGTVATAKATRSGVASATPHVVAATKKKGKSTVKVARRAGRSMAAGVKAGYVEYQKK